MVRLVALKRPAASVVTVRAAPVRVSVMTTVAPPIGAPLSSLTWPWMPVVICYAWAGAATTVATLIAIRLAAIE